VAHHLKGSLMKITVMRLFLKIDQEIGKLRVKIQLPINIGCSFRFLLKVSVEESIVNASRITDHGLTV
jgi:hypothetical protein